MRKTAITAAILAGTAILGTLPATASAATRPATPAQQTCSAFAAWQHHPTTARLDAIMTASLKVPWKYLGEDADDLYRAVRSGRDTSTAVQYFGEDCHNGSGL